MTRTPVPGPRVAALLVAITALFPAIAPAQSPDAAPAVTPSANTALLSSAAFGRLIGQQSAKVASDLVVSVSPQPGLLKQVATTTARQAMDRQAPTASTKPGGTPDRSWMARHKWAFIVPAIVAGGVLGSFGIAYLVIGEG
jgi:hypothetical protein